MFAGAAMALSSVSVVTSRWAFWGAIVVPPDHPRMLVCMLSSLFLKFYTPPEVDMVLWKRREAEARRQRARLRTICVDLGGGVRSHSQEQQDLQSMFQSRDRFSPTEKEKKIGGAETEEEPTNAGPVTKAGKAGKALWAVARNKMQALGAFGGGAAGRRGSAETLDLGKLDVPLLDLSSQATSQANYNSIN